MNARRGGAAGLACAHMERSERGLGSERRMVAYIGRIINEARTIVLIGLRFGETPDRE